MVREYLYAVVLLYLQSRVVISLDFGIFMSSSFLIVWPVELDFLAKPVETCLTLVLAKIVSKSILHLLMKNDETYSNGMLLHNQRPDGSNKYPSGR